jgi:hypothetical protein
MRGVSQARLTSGAFEHDTARVTVGESLNAGIFLTESHAPRQQYNR